MFSENQHCPATAIPLCQFNQSVDKDLKNGAYSRCDGIVCNDVVLQINEKNENRTKFIYGEKVNILFENGTESSPLNLMG